MKWMIVLLALTLVQSQAFAEVSDAHAMNKAAGVYKLSIEGAFLGSEVNFELNRKGQVVSAETDQEKITGKHVLVRTTDGLLKGLQVYHLVFGEGSDEEQHDVHAIMSFDEDQSEGHLTLKLVSVFEAINEGPNNASSVRILNKATLSKESESGKFEKVEKASLEN